MILNQRKMFSMHAIRLFFINLFILCALCTSQSSLADSATDVATDKYAIAEQIWEPVFSATQKDAKLNITPEQFSQINRLYYEAYSEFLSHEELTLTKKMFATSVGNKMAVNMARSLFQLQPYTLTYEDLSPKEKDEWESFSRENYTQVKSLEEKMKGFIPFLNNKYGKK